jgi:hypothetical protein
MVGTDGKYVNALCRERIGPSVRFVQNRPLGSCPIAAGLCKSASALALGQSDSHQIA